MVDDVSLPMPDNEIDAIYEAAYDAAIHAVTPHRVVNPYPEGSERAEVWSQAFRSAYARENGY